jgi:hypothetical protein
MRGEQSERKGPSENSKRRGKIIDLRQGKARNNPREQYGGRKAHREENGDVLKKCEALRPRTSPWWWW